MSNKLIEKLRESIDTNLLNLFTYEDLKLHKVMPLCEKESVIYVAYDEQSCSEKDIEFVQSILNRQIKLVPLSNVILLKLIDLYKEKTKQNVKLKTISITNVDGTKKRLGEILIEAGLITQEQLNNCLVIARKKNMPIGSVLVEEGIITNDQLREYLSAQQGIKFVHENEVKVNKESLNILPEDFIRLHKIVPIKTDGKSLVVGMVNPSNRKAINELVYLTGQKPIIQLMTYYEFKNVLKNHFSHVQSETDTILKKLEEESAKTNTEESLSEMVEREIQDASGSVAKFNTKIICDAIDMGTSDIHIEPRLSGYVVRFRVAGILKEILRIPPNSESAIITRYKVLAKMNIAEHRRPQDGTFSLKYKNISYDFRVNTLPVAGKEKMCIRILAPAVTLKSDDKKISLVGASENDIENVNRMIKCPNGIILASGPTGSGKTTTLYSILKNLNDEKVNITTVEDPVEIKIEGLNQSQMNAKAGITFASAMRAILRQDPDIIMVGEIRDYETLETAISAALTGHLVLSTVHTNSACATVTRLIEMGAKDYLVSSTLAGVIAQRLVRKLCPHCKESYHPSLEDAKLVVKNSNDYDNFMKQTIYRAKGCEKCEFEGYQGRLGVYEVLRITKELKKLIAINALELDIQDTAVKLGMQTLHQACLQHILAGETTINEFVRVLGPVDD